MIDTLRLAKRLQQANLSAEQSEAIVEAIADAQGDYVTKLRAVSELRDTIRAGLAKLKNALLSWLVGSVAVGVLINHFWK